MFDMDPCSIWCQKSSLAVHVFWPWKRKLLMGQAMTWGQVSRAVKRKWDWWMWMGAGPQWYRHVLCLRASLASRCFVLCYSCSIAHVPPRSNTYLENIGGVYEILIDTPNAPHESTWVETCAFLWSRYRCSPQINLACLAAGGVQMTPYSYKNKTRTKKIAQTSIAKTCNK